MKNKIRVSFNQNQFESASASLQQNLKKYKDYIDAVEKIMDVRDFKTLEEVETFIKAKTKFSNVGLSAGLLDVADSYQLILDNHNKINIEVLQFKGDDVSVKFELIDQAREEATEYLKEQYLKDYNVLLKACNELNSLTDVSYSNFLNRGYDGTFSINLQMLQNSDRL